MSKLLRLANAIMLVLFVSWAGFQYNDPDPAIWMIVYGLAALACVLFFLGRLPTRLGWGYAAICAVGAAYLMLRVVVASEFIFEEQGREMFGLLICAAWIGFLARHATRSTAVTSP